MWGWGSSGWSAKTTRRPGPDEEAWKPEFDRGSEPGEEVPERFRGLRLRRRRFEKMRRTPPIMLVVIGAMILGMVVVVWRVLSGYLGSVLLF